MPQKSAKGATLVGAETRRPSGSRAASSTKASKASVPVRPDRSQVCPAAATMRAWDGSSMKTSSRWPVERRRSNAVA